MVTPCTKVSYTLSSAQPLKISKTNNFPILQKQFYSEFGNLLVVIRREKCSICLVITRTSDTAEGLAWPKRAVDTTFKYWSRYCFDTGHRSVNMQGEFSYRYSQLQTLSFISLKVWITFPLWFIDQDLAKDNLIKIPLEVCEFTRISATRLNESISVQNFFEVTNPFYFIAFLIRNQNHLKKTSSEYLS